MVRSYGLVGHVALLAITTASFVGAAEEEPSAFVPVTDAMLADPPAEDWLTWRRTNNAWGYSPLESDHDGERRRARTGVDATAAPGQSDRDAAGVRRRDVHAEPQ